jgi:hypothetical protein
MGKNKIKKGITVNAFAYSPASFFKVAARSVRSQASSVKADFSYRQ